MTPRITCYVVFATLIWSAHTQDEEKVRGDMFKSNMTRNDFSKLLSSLIKLNEQRVSVLQRLHKLEDYGVLSEVLRSGDKTPENGNLNNLFLIVMSKNETSPSRRKLGFEVVDTVKSLDLGSNNIHPKLDYVLDPAGYVSQKTNKKNSIESIFGNIPIVRPKKTHLINDESKKNIKTIKPPKHRKPGQKTEDRVDTSILRNQKTGLKGMKNHDYNSKFEIVSKKRNTNPSQELRDNNENSKKYSPSGYHNPPQYPKLYMTKIIATKKFNNNYKDPLEGLQDGIDNGSPFNKEYVDKFSNSQDTKSDISIQKSKFNRNKSLLYKQDNKYTVIKTDIKSTTNKNYLRMMSTINTETDPLSNNNKNEKNHFEDKEDENNYDSLLSKEYTNRKYTKLYSDISIKKVLDNNPELKINSDSPNISAKDNQRPQFNQSNLNNLSNEFPKVMTEIKTTTNKNDLRIISAVNNSKTDTLSNYTKNHKFSLQDKDLEDENYYGTSFSKEYDEKNQNRQNIKIDYLKINNTVQDKQYPELNRSKYFVNNQDSTYSTKKAVVVTTEPKNDILILSTLKDDKVFENSEKPYLNIDLIKSNNEQASKEKDNSSKLTSQALKSTIDKEIPVTTKILPSKNYFDYPKDVGNDTKKYNPEIVENLLDGVHFGNQQSGNITNHDNKTPSSRIMEIENVDAKTIPKDSPLHLKDVTENANKDKPKDLDNEYKSNVEPKKRKDQDGKEKFNKHGQFIIDKKDGEDFSIIVTHVRKDKPGEIIRKDKPEEIIRKDKPQKIIRIDKSEEIKRPTKLKISPKEFDQPDGKPIERKAFQKCLNKKARKLCYKSCKSAYKNVCQRLKCTSRARKDLKKECKRSCKKTFASSSSKYSDESYSDYSYSDESYSDYS